MSTLNNSIIICYENPKPTKEKAFSRKKKVHKNVKRTFYESPLRHIQLSSKRWAQAQKRLLCNTNQVCNKRKDSFCFAKESLQDSVIILSDNENESNNKDDESKQEIETRKRFLDLSINGEGNPQCNSNETLSQMKTTVEGPPRKKRKKDIVALSENNSICPSVSNTIIDLDDENIALVSDSINQSLDDIVVVWSSTKTIPSSAETIPSSVETVPLSAESVPPSAETVAPSTETVPQSVKTPVSSAKTPPLSVKTLPCAKIPPHSVKILPCAKTSLLSIKTFVPSVNQSEEEPINRKKNDRIFMIDTTPNKNNLSCLQSNEDILEQYETNTEKDAKNKKEEEEESAETCLPFSKRRLKFPKPHNISKNIMMTKPKTTQRLRSFRRPVTNYTTSTFTSTTSTISTTFNTSATSTISTTFNTPIIPTISTTFDTSTIHTISSTSTLPLVYNMPVAYNYSNLYDFSNPGFQTTFEPSFMSYPQLSTTGSSVPQPLNRLREIVIDGNNIAMAYRKHKIFAEEGIKIVVEYFQKRGHSVKVFVPHHRRSLNHPLLEKLYTDGIVIFTPSRVIGGKRITPYDDRYILEYATMCGGIVVSLDQYRDLYLEKPEWRDTIEKRLLIPTFVGNYVMFPEDPLGRGGPTLEEFLRH
ncbi:uncharacterized protein LOC122577946 [Bombus pyrosoma]|uniref:uncharacterized protein LOC122577946 n=1 Tax=Bombus pyrosoma TaxID=396416 RepID=UPI001CB91054|nr:uncharacterized protein LOC122577946 [Bombus pyrosoma]XP_043605619.1 uncharacterized protein LOC122577946 [Bombus pyrosoma]XP_043605620.1 uncharacterized protein LOC122577946 [Bombus pyrosoma]XP_043605621.1 uncharacterized protein LOC122577946 [Bombus pyrosoma]